MDIISESDPKVEAALAPPASQDARDSAEKKRILQEYRQRLAKDPRNVALLNEVGLAAEAVGDKDRARWAYKRAMRLDPGYEQSYRNLGLLDRREGREGPAVEALQKSVKWSDDEADLQTALDVVDPSQKPGDIKSAGAERATSPAEVPIYNRLDRVWQEMDLTPAEAMMLLDLESSNGLQMMRVTLMDLVARSILAADSRQRIGRGESFDQSNLAPHEALFVKYFSRISDYVDVDRLARAALAELDDDGQLFKADYVRASLVQKGYLEYETRRIAGLIPVQQAVPSKKGMQAKTRLQRLLKEADRQLARSLASNPEQANAYVEKGGPALLLMDGYPTHYFKKWDALLTRMGLGPAVERLRTKARKSELGAYIEDILKVLLGS